MQVRFVHAEAPERQRWELKRVELLDRTCECCGFRGGRDHRAFRREDGTEVAACQVCFVAHHALSADPDLFRLAWIPEISQGDLGHLARVSAVLLMRHPEDRRDSPSTASEIARRRAPAIRIARALRARARVLETSFEEFPGGSVQGAWGSLDDAARGALLPGLRLLPVAFDEREVREWVNGDGSLYGYGAELLARHDWFAADIGRVPREPPKAAEAKAGGDSGSENPTVTDFLESLAEED